MRRQQAYKLLELKYKPNVASVATLLFPLIAIAYLLFKVIQGHRLLHTWNARMWFPISD